MLGMCEFSSWIKVKVSLLLFFSAVIEPCLDTELSEFPLRMRDWLKNVLVTLYERDEDNNLLTEKQKLRVRQTYSTGIGAKNAKCDVF